MEVFFTIICIIQFEQEQFVYVAPGSKITTLQTVVTVELSHYRQLTMSLPSIFVKKKGNISVHFQTIGFLYAEIRIGSNLV